MIRKKKQRDIHVHVLVHQEEEDILEVQEEEVDQDHQEEEEIIQEVLEEEDHQEDQDHLGIQGHLKEKFQDHQEGVMNQLPLQDLHHQEKENTQNLRLQKRKKSKFY